MSRRCIITKKGVMSGNNVSHSNGKKRRTFRPNVSKIAVKSEILGCKITLKISSHGLRTIEHNHGLDQYLLDSRVSSLSPEARSIRKLLLRRLRSAEINSSSEASIV